MPSLVLVNSFILRQNNGNAIDLDTDTIKASIHSSAYTFSPTTHDFFDDVTNEVSGGNYVAGGTAIAGVTLALDGNTVEWIFNDIVWSQHATGFTNGRTVVLRKDTGVASTSPIIGAVTATGDFGNVDGPFTFDGDAAAGVLNITRS